MRTKVSLKYSMNDCRVIICSILDCFVLYLSVKLLCETLRENYLRSTETYSEPCQTSKMELSTVNYFRKKLHLRRLPGF